MFCEALKRFISPKSFKTPLSAGGVGKPSVAKQGKDAEKAKKPPQKVEAVPEFFFIKNITA
ncbi:MAG: hypothetical protein C4308_05520 [Chitinophagaceae bacterium]